MTEDQVGNWFTFGVAVFGMLICLAIGYYSGYTDAKKQMRNKDE